jgi:HSP20 family protein
MTRQTHWRREFSAPLTMLQNELNRLLEEYWTPSRIGPTQSAPTDLEPAGWSPAVDLFETPEEIVLLAELPGVEPSSIDLSLTGNVLSLRGVKAADEASESHSRARERQFGSFHRQFVLSNEVNFDAAQADSRNGVLRVRLPKQEAAKPRSIPIQNP